MGFAAVASPRRRRLPTGRRGYTLRLAEDVYPNDPNVRRYTVTFPENLFDDPRFTITEVGPFAVVTRAEGA